MNIGVPGFKWGCIVWPVVAYSVTPASVGKPFELHIVHATSAGVTLGSAYYPLANCHLTQAEAQAAAEAATAELKKEGG